MNEPFSKTNRLEKDTSLTERFVPSQSGISKTWMNLCELGDRQSNRNRPDRDAGDGCSGIDPLITRISICKYMGDLSPKILQRKMASCHHPLLWKIQTQYYL